MRGTDIRNRGATALTNFLKWNLINDNTMILSTLRCNWLGNHMKSLTTLIINIMALNDLQRTPFTDSASVNLPSGFSYTRYFLNLKEMDSNLLASSFILKWYIQNNVEP